MKKLICLIPVLLIWLGTRVNAQPCYGTIKYDTYSNANGNSNFTITTANPNELILVTYNGWPGPGTGPVTVDGNPTTMVKQVYQNWGTTATVVAYMAPAAGLHTVNCPTGGFFSPYFLNSATAFYAINTPNLLSIASLTNAWNSIGCVTGGSITASITTTIPGTVIFCDFDCNNGQIGPFNDSFTSICSPCNPGNAFLGKLHEGFGIDASQEYETACTPGTYSVTATCPSQPANGCGGLALVLVAIPPPTAPGPCNNNNIFTATCTPTNPTCNQNNGSICVSATGGVPPYTYIWTPPVGTGACVSGLSAGTYTVEVKDASCDSSVFVKTLTTVNVNIVTSVTADEKCFGQCIGSATASANGGVAPYTYNWAPAGGNTPSASNLCAGTYTITVRDVNGCTNTATVTITQPAALTMAPAVTDPLCHGAVTGAISTNASGGTPAYVYTWTPNVSNGANATGLSAGIYTVSVSDANGCSTSSAIAITQPAVLAPFMGFPVPVSCYGGNNGSIDCSATGGTPGYNYSWAPAGGNTYHAGGLTAGIYTVTITDANGCTATASVAITQPLSAMNVTLVNPVEVACNGDSTGSATASVTGGTQNYTYFWSPGGQTDVTATGLVAGAYNCLVTDAFGCTANANIQISEPTAIILNTLGTPTTCNGGNDGQANVIPVPGGGVPPYTYSWSNNATTPAITGLTAGIYTITVLDSHGCISRANVLVSQPPAILVSFSADTLKGCSPLCTDFNDMSSDPNYALNKWSWDFGDSGTDNVASPRHCYSAPGMYSVTLTVTDNMGCTNSLTIPNMIEVYSYPIPSFVMSPQPTTLLQPEIQFSDKSTDVYGPITSWYWEFNDPLSHGVNDISNLQNPKHKYLDTGTYCAVLTVSNLRGCKDSVTECVVISNDYTLWIPDAFTPDGNGKNDIFLPKGEAIQQFSMYIFDRWGTMIYSTNDINKGWNGAVNGGSTICPEDTYVYEINVTDSFNKTHSYIGKVTLIK